MQNNLSCVSVEFFDTIQTLYQNKQISKNQKNQLVCLFKNSLSEDYLDNKLILTLKNIQYSVDEMFIDQIEGLINLFQ